MLMGALIEVLLCVQVRLHHMSHGLIAFRIATVPQGAVEYSFDSTADCQVNCNSLALPETMSACPRKAAILFSIVATHLRSVFVPN